jgi:hypothetical protein
MLSNSPFNELFWPFSLIKINILQIVAIFFKFIEETCFSL